MLNTLNKMWYLLSRRERGQAGLLFALMLVGAVLEMLGVGAIPAFVSVLENPERLLQYDLVRRVHDGLGITSNEEFILWAAGGLALVFVCKNVYLAFLEYARARYTQRRSVTIGRRLFRAYLRSPYTFHLQRNTADLLRNTHEEARRAIRSVLVPSLRIALEGVTLAAILLLLFWAEPVVSLVAALGLGTVSGGFYYVIRRRLTEYGRQGQHYSGKMIQSVNEGLGGIKTTKLLGREQHFEQSYAANAAGWANASIFRSYTSALPRLFIETTAMVGLLLVAVVFIAQGRSLSSLIPTLTLFAAASVRLIPSFNRITTSFNQLKFGHHAVDVIYDDLRALEAKAVLNGQQEERLPLEQRITMHEVDYRYPEADERALKGVSLEIPKGSAVAFVGPSGAGKTTAVNVILGLLEPEQGSVRVDGRDIRENLKGWQRQIGYIPQDIYLADATIRENVAFGLKGDAIDDEAVRRAIRSAQLDELVGRLPEGLDTMVGERGVRLSGGQRQRIGIARALYHNPQVLVMDEATSDLDNQTERTIMEAVERLRGDRTLIIIAHRLSTVRGCDRLFFLDDGRLDDAGTYETLLDTSGAFRAMAAV